MAATISSLRAVMGSASGKTSGGMFCRRRVLAAMDADSLASSRSRAAVAQGRVPGLPQPVQAAAQRTTIPGHGLGQLRLDAAYSETKGRHGRGRFILLMVIENYARSG